MRSTIPRARSPSNYTPKPLQHFLQKGVMFIMKKNKTRIGALLMAMVMIFTMLPLNVFAAGGQDNPFGGGHNSSSGGVNHGPSTGAWAVPTGNNAFTRFTLIEYPDGVTGVNPTTGKPNVDNHRIVGRSFNIYNVTDLTLKNAIPNSDDNSGRYVIWFATNAQGYKDYKDEKGNPYDYFSEAWTNAAAPGSWEVGNFYTMSSQEFADRAGVNRSEVDKFCWAGKTGIFGTDSWENGEYAGNFAIPGTGVEIEPGVYSFDANYQVLGSLLLEMAKNNEYFPDWYNMAIGNMHNDRWNAKGKQQAIDKFINTRSGNGTTTYRILAEPGFFAHRDNAKQYYALTIRDAIAYNETQEGGHYDSAHNESIAWGLGGIIGERGLNLSLGVNQLLEFDTGVDGQSIAGTGAFADTCDFMKTQGDLKMAAYEKQHEGTSETGIYSYDVAAEAKRTVFNEDQGWGLGIISPCLYKGEPASLIVQKVLVGDVPAEDKSHMWEFTLSYSDRNASPADWALPTETTVMIGDTNVVTDPSRVQLTNNGFKFWAKAGEMVKINFDRPAGRNVYYYVSETDQKASDYVTTMIRNSEDVTFNDSGVRQDAIWGNTTKNGSSLSFINSAGLTISKKVEGGGSFANEEFNFDIICSNAQWQGLSAAEAGSIPVIYSNGQKDTFNLSFGVDGNNRGEFSLKNGESVRVLIPGDWQYQITEARAGTGEFSTTVNGDQLEGTSFYSSTATLNPKAEFINSKGYNAKAHVVIDYNFNGAPATDESGNPGIDLSTIVDCGKHQVGDNVPLHPVIQTSNGTHSLGPNDKGYVAYTTTTNSSAGGASGSATFSLTFKGLFDKAKGGNELPTVTLEDGGTYYVVNNIHEGMNTVYAQWEPTLTSTVIPPEPVETTPPSQDPGEHKSTLYTAYFSENYIGGGITSALYGTFYVPIAMKAARWVDEPQYDDEGNYTGCDHHWEWDVGGEGDYWSWLDSQWDISETFEIDIPFAPPKDPMRSSWRFIGWTATEPDTLINTSDIVKPGVNGDGMRVYGAGYNDFIKSATAWLRNNWLPGINASNCSGSFESDMLTPKPTKKAGETYYALWYHDPVGWDANGGEFTGPYAGQSYHFDIGAYVHNSLVPILDGKSSTAAPVRKGYTFDQWYYDKKLMVPLVEQDTGVTPNRDYFAGWIPEPVIVTYYDTREGETVVHRQTYNYDDLLDLLGDMNDTTGWLFSGWYTSPTGGTKATDNKTLAEGLFNNALKVHNVEDPTKTDYQHYWTLDLYAQWNQAKATHTVTVRWDDETNNDNVRPKTMTFGLVSSVTNEEVSERTITVDRTAATQDVYFDSGYRGDLPVTINDASTERILYTAYLKSYVDMDGHEYIVEDTSLSTGDIVVASPSDYDTAIATSYGYSWNRVSDHDPDNLDVPGSVSQAKAYTSTLFFKHKLITTGNDIVYTIRWDDDSNRDGVRPGAVTLQLLANGKPLSSATSPSEHNSYTGIVSLNPAMCEVSEDGNTWTYIFQDYQKYLNGKPIDYTIQISDYTDEYTVVTANPDAHGVTLRHIPQTADVPVTIIWDDELNRDGLRPNTVDVTLTAYQWNDKTFRWEEMLVGTKTVTGNSTDAMWNVAFEDENVFCGGQRIIYKASVSSDLNAHIPTGSNGYSWVGNETTITISHNKDVKDVPVTIHWDDHNNNDSIRPTTAIIQLWADGKKVSGAAHAATVTGSDKDDVWTYTFKDMPIYRDGKSGEEIVYHITVEETVKDSIYGTYTTTANGEMQLLTRYTATYMFTDAEGNTITTEDASLSDRTWIRLTHAIDQGTIDVYASWHDEQNRDNKRPASLQVELYKQVDGIRTYMRTVTLIAGRDNSWANRISGLPLFEDGKEIIYLVDISEDFRNELMNGYGYTVATQENVVHLYYTPQTGSVSTKLYWADDDDNDSIRPDTVKATLVINGKVTDKTIDLNAENEWSGTWTDLDTYFGDRNGLGQLTMYSVKVEDVDGYTVTYTPAAVTTETNQTIYINMSHGANLASVPVHIYWNDNRNMDGIRPENVTVQLYADGEPVVGKTLVVDGDMASEVWTGVFESLPTHNNGEEIYYTVKAADTIGRTFEVMTAGTSLYLSREAEKGDLYVSFRFDDANNADGFRPEGGYLQLQVVDAEGNEENVEGANGVHTIYFDADGRTNDYFRGLTINKTSGIPLQYTVKVVWDDEIFGGNGGSYNVAYSRPIKLSTVSQNQLVITASRPNDLGVERGTIYWFDNNNQRRNRPSELMLNVYNDVTSNVEIFRVVKDTDTSGTVYDEAGNKRGEAQIAKWGEGKAATQWKYSIDQLPQNSIYNGKSKPIYYWATARDTGLVPWYTTTDGERNGLDVLLTHVNYLDDVGSSTQNFDIHVNWMDNQNAWGYRPDTLGIDVELLANGESFKTVHMTIANAPEENENAWTYRFLDLPTFLDGTPVVWTAKVNDQLWYVETVSNYADYSVIKMTQGIGFNLTANWNDSDNDDAVRPSNVIVDVMADGIKVGSVTMTGEGNTWTGEIKDMPVWRETGDKAVNYTFAWAPETKAQIIDNQYVAAATMNGEPVEAKSFYYLSTVAFGDKNDAGLSDLTGMYEWETTLTRNKETTTVNAEVRFDDDANRDGLRPESVLVQLLANGKPLGEPVEVTGESTESSWFISWPEVEVYEGGKPIVYTVELTAVPKDYTLETSTDGQTLTLTHVPERISVEAFIKWMDNTELHFIRNSVGDLVTTLAQIKRVPVYAQLLANGEPFGEPELIGTEGYDTGKALLNWTPADWDGIYKTTLQNGMVTIPWNDLYKFQNEGDEIVYTFRVYSDDLNELLENQRHKMVYSEDQLTATVTRELFDATGTVYYLYDTSKDFLLGGVTVTAYLYDAETKTYTAVGSAETAEDGTFAIKNLPQGMLTFRATYQYGDYTYAGSAGLRLDRHDGEVKIIVNRDAEADSDLYRYKAEGKAFYQTDITDDSTITPVPAGSIVLLYKVVHGQTEVQYVGMTTTDAAGAYKFENMASGQYLVNVVFNYDGGTYTYDNADALRDGLTFNILGADMKWPDIIKQVNKSVEPGPGPVDPEEPTPPEPVLPEPCIVSGNVFFSDNGTHTTEPVEGVDVYIYSAENNAELGHVSTDKDGHWTMEGLGAQDYIAVFSYQGNASRVLQFTITGADYEAGTYEAATQYFDRTTKEPTALIQGVVLNEQGERTSALVQILNQNGDVVAVAYTDKTGAYSFTVPAGLTYQVRILEVAENETKQAAGDPDDVLTTLDYYVISGNFSIDGEPQSGSTVAVYKQDEDLNFNLLTATLSDENGDYSVKLLEGGNYNVITYRNGDIYSQHKVSVGYQEWEPKVTEQNGTYTISGVESFDALELRDTTTGVVRLIETLEAGEEYSISGLAAGIYDIKMIKGLEEKHYYIDCPKNEIDVTYFVTVAGSVTTEEGKAVLGAIVSLYDEAGKKVGEDTVITNGSYNYPELPEGKYEIRVKYPVAGETLADKTTADLDSYGLRYIGGMPEDSVWTWNINATKVSGSVKDQKGDSVAFATIVLRDNNDPNKAYGVIADENGNWTIGVQAGSYTVDAMYELDADHIYHAKETKVVVVKNSAVDGVELVIDRFDLTVTIVRDGDKKPLPGADVKVTLTDGTEIWTGEADENGNITITVMPDAYKVTASFEDGEGEKTITVGSDLSETVTIGIPMYLTGTVYEFDGTTPVADAIVYYEGPVAGKIYTDKNGCFSLSLMASEAGYYNLYAVASGSTSSRMMVFVGTDTTVDIIMPEVIHETETYVLSGVVTDNEGNRLENAIVTVNYGDDKTRTMQTSTNEMGVYRFQVEDGTYYITAIYEASNGYVYSTNAERAVHVNGADELEANLVITLAYPVTITVMDSEDNVIEDAEVFFSGAAAGSMMTNADGEIETMLPGGDYEFFAVVGNRKTAVVSITVKSATSLALVVGMPGLAEEAPNITPTDLTITGFVIDPNGDPVEGANVILLQFNKETEEWEEIQSENSDAEGFYEFTGLTDGRYRVEIEYILENTVEGEHTRFEITGFALDDSGNPYVGAVVNLYDGEDLVETVYTDEQGYYEFLNLEHDGSYKVEIIPVNDEGEQTTIEEDITAEPSNTVIEGVVVDAAGRPVEGATVIVTDENDAEYSMTTKEDGEYHFELDVSGEVTVTIIYPAQYEGDTENGYEPDDSDPNAPSLNDDGYIISGYVHDTDDNAVEGAEVKLLDKEGNELQATISDEDGYYEFKPVRPGEYTVVVIWGQNEKSYEVDADGNTKPVDPEPDEPEIKKIHVAGAVVTNHKTPLVGAVVTVRNADTGESFQLIADKNGMFHTDDMDPGRYELSAVYAHEYGSNSSDTVTVIRTQEDVALVIILSYVNDVNGDGEDETVFAGNDDEFDTPDDFYEADVGNDGVKDPVYAGEDGKPGTEDDYYPWDVDHDGESEKVYVGEDKIPGTEDDWYPCDVDDDGKDDKVFIGDDCIPGTEDDWYNKDVDGDGDDEKVYIGDDETPGTDDDWYEDDEGNKIYLRVVVTFNANGGSVNGKTVYEIPLRKLHNLPGADRNNYTFDGWFLQTSGGSALTMAQLKAYTENVTVYAHWTAKSTTPGGSGGSGGGGGGGGGGGVTITDPETPLAPLVEVTFKNFGDKDEVVSVPNGSLVEAPTNIRVGYKLIGWFQDETLTEEWDLSKDTVTQDMTLWAKLEYVGPSAYLTTDHIAYIGGMPDGNVYPANNITRAEVAMIFYRLLNDETRAKYKTDSNEFSDVNEEDWFNVAISTLSNMGIVKGRGQGLFDPTANITRGEFAVICSRFDSLSDGDKVAFSDVNGHWASKEILSAAAKGWVKGYEDGTFKPDNNIARHETITLINRVLGRDTITVESIVTTDPMITWPDNSNVNAWFYLAIQEATNGHHFDLKGEHEQWTSLGVTHVGNE